tara:strand:+ start:4008 stop:4310 length:303 start_codon:yes stop_codon:yes gene_type:complete
MKTKDYVKKYELNKDDSFSRKDFIQDFTNDFNGMLEVAKIGKDYVRFKRLIEDSKKKWSNINNKTAGQLPKDLWIQFYSTVITSCEHDLFPHLTNKKIKS